MKDKGKINDLTAKQYLKKVAKNIYQHHELSDFNECIC